MKTNIADSSAPTAVAEPSSPAHSQPRITVLPDGTEILNKAEVARRLGVTERHIEHLIKSRQIPHLRIGSKSLRFVWADVVRELSVESRQRNA